MNRPDPAALRAALPEPRDLARLALYALVAGAVFFLFHYFGCALNNETSAFNWMTEYWINPAVFTDATYWQGPLIPLSALVVIAWRHKTFARLPRRASAWGLALIAAALLIHWVGLRAQQPRISLFALLVLLGGLVWLEFGWAWLKELLFPLGLLIFCIPMNFFDALTFPMRVLSAQLAAGLLAGFGVELAAQGAALVDPASGAIYDGSDAASSVQMLLLTGWLSALVAYILCRHWVTRWIAFGLFLPAILLANILRLVLIGLLHAAAGAPAAAAVHQGASTGIVAVLTLAFVAAGPLLARRLIASTHGTLRA
jgi:exosortase